MPARQATCHPAKKNFGGGRCANCYYRHRYKTDKSFRRRKLAQNKAGRLKTTPGQRRGYKLKSKYGITIEQYNAMLRKQKGLCAACDRPPGGCREFLAVDHDHSCCPGERSCGKCVRALLHVECNAAIGLVKEDPAILHALAAYLIREIRAIREKTKWMAKI